MQKDAGSTLSFLVDTETSQLLSELDAFIEDKIKPIQAADDNERFFDHRREWARTDWDKGGLPREEWEALMTRVRKIADEAGYFRLGMPKALGGKEASFLTMAIIREHFNAKGIGLHNDAQSEHSIVGNVPLALVVLDSGTEAQKAEFCPRLLSGEYVMAFGLTEPDHGSDATHMETTAVRDGDDWIITGEKTWNTGAHVATHNFIVARTSGKDGDAFGLTGFIVPMKSKGVNVAEFLWTFNMPSDHARVELKSVRVPNSAILGPLGQGLKTASIFLTENRLRQAASSLGAACYCINESVAYANSRKLFGKPVSSNQAIQWPLVELHTESEMLRLLIRTTASQMDQLSRQEAQALLGARVSMCNYRANRLACEAADWAIQLIQALGLGASLMRWVGDNVEVTGKSASNICAGLIQDYVLSLYA
ncbi:hypothetical protein RQP46_009321 [Phenoliferia psychrophenolica]